MFYNAIYLITCITILNACKPCKESHNSSELNFISSLKPKSDSLMLMYIGDIFYSGKITNLPSCTHISQKSVTFKYHKDKNNSYTIEQISKEVDQVVFYYYYDLEYHNESILLNVNLSFDSVLTDSSDYIDKLKVIKFLEINEYYKDVPQLFEIAKEENVRIKWIDLMIFQNEYYWVLFPQNNNFIKLLVNIENHSKIIKLPNYDGS